MLKDIEQILKDEQFECSFIPRSDQAPYEKLYVFLGLDPKNREKMLEIKAQEETFDPNAQTKYSRIQFQFKFPFKVKELAFNQVASLILFINQSIDFPGLELNELTDEVSYRYVWLVKNNEVDPPLVHTIMGLILLLLELFTPSIERLAEGQSTFNDLLEEILQITKIK